MPAWTNTPVLWRVECIDVPMIPCNSSLVLYRIRNLPVSIVVERDPSSRSMSFDEMTYHPTSIEIRNRQSELRGRPDVGVGVGLVARQQFQPCNYATRLLNTVLYWRHRNPFRDREDE